MHNFKYIHDLRTNSPVFFNTTYFSHATLTSALKLLAEHAGFTEFKDNNYCTFGESVSLRLKSKSGEYKFKDSVFHVALFNFNNSDTSYDVIITQDSSIFERLKEILPPDARYDDLSLVSMCAKDDYSDTPIIFNGLPIKYLASLSYNSMYGLDSDYVVTQNITSDFSPS